MKFYTTLRSGRLPLSHVRTARPIKIAACFPGLCAAMVLSTTVLCAPICSRAVSSVTIDQSVRQSAPAIYIADGDGNLLLVTDAFLSVQEGAVYTDTCLLGYLATYDDTIIVASNGTPIGRVVYSSN